MSKPRQRSYKRGRLWTPAEDKLLKETAAMPRHVCVYDTGSELQSLARRLGRPTLRACMRGGRSSAFRRLLWGCGSRLKTRRSWLAMNGGSDVTGSSSG